jgi:glucose-6-phosphate-specific signal transduction histidine kinase
MTTALKKALHEATYDTLIGAIIMFPLSYVIIKFCAEMDWRPFATALANFTFLTGIAIARKTFVRLKFAKMYSTKV